MTRFIRKPSRPVLAALAALSLTTQAHAVSVVWGNHGPARLAQAQPLDYFIDTYSFTVGSGSWNIASTAVANELVLGGQSVFSIIGGSYGLYADPDGRPESGDETAVGAGLSNFNGGTGDLSSVATIITGGSYYYLVTGLPIGSAGGAYQLTSAVAAAVPEPAALALMLAGVAVVGGAVAARRRRST